MGRQFTTRGTRLTVKVDVHVASTHSFASGDFLRIVTINRPTMVRQTRAHDGRSCGADAQKRLDNLTPRIGLLSKPILKHHPARPRHTRQTLSKSHRITRTWSPSVVRP